MTNDNNQQPSDFEEVYDEHYNQSKKLASYLFGSPHHSAVDEIVQDVWLAVWKKMGNGEPDCWKAWIRQVTRFKCIDWKRRHGESRRDVVDFQAVCEGAPEDGENVSTPGRGQLQKLASVEGNQSAFLGKKERSEILHRLLAAAAKTREDLTVEELIQWKIHGDSDCLKLKSSPLNTFNQFWSRFVKRLRDSAEEINHRILELTKPTGTGPGVLAESAEHELKPFFDKFIQCFGITYYEFKEIEQGLK